MKITRIKKLPLAESKIARSVCIGLFDGVHRGHLQLIKRTIAFAKKNNLRASMFTFDPAPKNFIFKRNYPHLMSLELKAQVAADLGLDELIVLDFNQQIADLSPEQFIDLIIKPLNIKKMVIGYDFTYGKKGAGNAQTLLALNNQDFQVEVISEIDYLNKKISSTRTVEALMDGQPKLASKLLGRNYMVEGKVVHGNGNGKKIGYPTANLDIGDYALPKNGVYAVKVHYEGRSYFGMANIGIHPTVKLIDKPLLEVNIFKFDKEIYGDQLKVEFIEYLRAEQKFESLKALVNQLKKDKKKVLSLLKKVKK
jgi:riboflavin kinase/FMN adenylyltransferase